MSNFIKISQETFCDARIEKAVSILKTSKPLLLYDLIQIWMTCQTRKRGVLSTKELAASIICGPSLDVVHALYDTTLLMSPADMRPIVKEEWLTKWALEGTIEVNPQAVVELFYESTNSLRITNDHYLYVAGSYDCLHWRRSNVENGRKGGLKAAERRRSKAGPSKPGYSDPIATVQRGYSDPIASLQGATRSPKSSQSSQAIATVQPGYSDGIASVQPRKSSEAIATVQRGYSDGIAGVEPGYSGGIAISSELKPYVYVSASTEAGDEDSSAPEGADHAAAPPTPLDVGAVQKQNPEINPADPSLDHGMDRDAEWFSQVAHQAMARFTMRGRKPVCVKNDEAYGEIERWSGWVTTAYVVGASVSCFAQVDITELRQPTKPLLVKLAKLLVYASPKHGLDAVTRFIGAYVQAALIWRDTGSSYWLPTVDNFLVTQEKYKLLERKEKHAILPRAGTQEICKWAFDLADGVFAGECNETETLETLFSFMFGGFLQTPIVTGTGKNTIIKLRPIVGEDGKPISPAKLEKATPAKKPEPALESTQDDEPMVTYPQLTEAQIDPIAASTDDVSYMEVVESSWPDDPRWHDSAEGDYESTHMN